MAAAASVSIFVLVGFLFALMCGFISMLAGFGSRWKWWHFRTGFAILRWSAYAGVLAAVIAGIGLIASLQEKLYDGVILAVFGMLVGLVTSGNTWNWKQSIVASPPIHDITTDTQNPPQFVSILPLRKGAENPAEYGGPTIAAQQLKAYPDIKPFMMNLPIEAAFDKALQVVRSKRWNLIAVNRYEGRIEAVDTTFWFGFKDDIIIRITQDGERSRIDLRSVSRVGRTDVGKNAHRIRDFFKRLREF